MSRDQTRSSGAGQPAPRSEDALAVVRQETTEARNLSIRTEHAVRSLGGEIRQLQRSVDGLERRSFFNSAVAYFLFAALTFIGLLLFFRASVERNALDQALAAERITTLEARIAELETDLQARRESEREAWQFHELIVAERYEEAVERFGQVQGRLQDRTTVELFRRELERYRHRLAEDAWLAGRRYAGSGEWAEARDALLRSHGFAAVVPYATERAWWLAESLHALRDYRAAASWYEEALSPETLGRRDAAVGWFRMAESLERSGQREAAVAAYETFLGRFSTHGWRATAQQRLSGLQARIEAERRDED
ncbi:MAG: hypothetical protein EA398_08395 [Deltaproteobacteria bacterium]|nr:MAG: hypothetical protein EA398_08395 [Deltaproteobacteria bacterium]